jgi:hypothetical protein
MACKHDTAHVRRLVRNKSNSTSTSSVGAPVLARESERKRRQLYVERVADTALALAVIEGMLKTHEAFKQANEEGTRSGLLPFNAVQVIGLTSAMEKLHHYADMLLAEQRG